MLCRGRVEVTGGFFLLMAWLNYCDTQGLFPAALCAAAAHELGHWAAIRALGGQVALFRLSAAGAELRLEGTLSYGRELLCALAGPLVNLALAIWAAQRGPTVFAGLNLALGFLNLLPISVLDGGKILSSVTSFLFGQETARWLSAGVDGILSVFLLVCGVAVLGAGGNVTLLVVAVWLTHVFLAAVDKTWRKKGLSRVV